MSDKINLLKETIENLKANGKTLDDTKWFGTKDFRIDADITQFLNINYDNGFGGNEIPLEFIIVGDDFWLERHEYDGSEWWEFKTMPDKPVQVRLAGSFDYGSEMLPAN